MTLQEIVNTITKVQSKMRSKVFWNLSQSTAVFWKLWRGFCRPSKMIDDNTSDTSLAPNVRVRVLISNMNLVFLYQTLGSHSLFDVRVTFPLQTWGWRSLIKHRVHTPCKMRESRSLFKHEPCMRPAFLPQTRTLYQMRDPHFCYNR